jgi:hypothetical protein
MSKTHMSVRVAFTVNDPEHLPEKNGEQMYSDDVADEIIAVITAAMEKWYVERGKDLLACEPIIV